VIGGRTPCRSIADATSGGGEAKSACAPGMSWTSAVMAMLLLPSSAT
jgi:hypothetical protein